MLPLHEPYGARTPKAMRNFAFSDYGEVLDATAVPWYTYKFEEANPMTKTKQGVLTHEMQTIAPKTEIMLRCKSLAMSWMRTIR